MLIEESIANARNQFEQLLQYVSTTKKSHIGEVEKNIFQSLLKLGMALILIFIKNCIIQPNNIHRDITEKERNFHSLKKRNYYSVFGKITIYRPYYWRKSLGGICPLDADLNLPDCEYSYLLQEWGSCLATEQPYNKAVSFLEKFLNIPLWDSTLEGIVRQSSVNVADFYQKRCMPSDELEDELLIATVDCKGVPMRKSELIKTTKKRRKYIDAPKFGERMKKQPDEPNEEKKTLPNNGKKKMSTVTAVYSLNRNIRTAEDVLSNHKKKNSQKKPFQHRPKNKIVYGTLDKKEEAFEHLKLEISKRNCKNTKCIALVDGETRLTELLSEYLPGFEIIRDVVHVQEYLWDAAHIFYKEGTEEAKNWVSRQFEMLLRGQIEHIIIEINGAGKRLGTSKKKKLKKVITYLQNGKEYMKYDHYLAEGYPIASGVIEGACKHLVNDRCEHSGMHWTVKGANAVLALRSININKLEKEYWNFHRESERQRLYGDVSIEKRIGPLAA